MDVVIEAIIMILLWIGQKIQPFIKPASFIIAWGLVGVAGWGVVSFFRDGFKRAQKMHKIPCANCQYFTDNYYLKCPIRPSIALSEAAINCTDYEESVGYYS